MRGFISGIVALIVVTLTLNASAAIYYVRADGTASTKTTALDPTNASTSMSVTTFNAATFADLDVIYFSSRGGQFNVTGNGVVPPSGGSTIGKEITYAGEIGYPPVIDGGNTATNCITHSGISNIFINDFTVQNALSDGMIFGGTASNIIVNRPRGSSTSGTSTWIGSQDHATVTINDPYAANTVEHCFGLHNTGSMVINGGSCVNPAKDAIHSIDTASVTANNLTVINGGIATALPAFQLEGTGVNIVRNPLVYISSGSRQAFGTGTTSTISVYNPVVVFQTGVNSATVGVGLPGSGGTINVYNGTFVETDGTHSVRMLQMPNTSAGTMNVYNSVFVGGYATVSTSAVLSNINLFNCAHYDMTNDLDYNATAAPIGSTPSTWAVGTSYANNAYVTYGGSVYLSLHSANVGNTPPTTGTMLDSNWQRANVIRNVADIITNPNFVSSAANNFHLVSSSPLIAKGLSGTGASLTDYTGGTYAVPPVIGAFEYLPLQILRGAFGTFAAVGGTGKYAWAIGGGSGKNTLSVSGLNNGIADLVLNPGTYSGAQSLTVTVYDGATTVKAPYPLGLGTSGAGSLVWF